MNVLQYQVFAEAISEHPKLEADIKALYCFLQDAEIRNEAELHTLFPLAVKGDNGLSTLLSFANGKLIFDGQFNYEGNFVLSNSIQAGKKYKREA
ncbi:TPA: hypothetical protein I8Y00_005301 [Citrobacter farmeri]|uniref:Uncharacterized protein n=2 Tax=Citrobacter TaxID=544 RepID=A0AAP9TYW5_CITFR|nr:MULTISPECIES: hypothetical protein [Enterobacteriaceae]EHK0948261.1 hypothetical protein [Citrobacter farmeri]EKT9197350.1 hypothetical protein [Citrobacter freundii]EKX4543605.1 hypothetical protein [Citrobacter farmeri]ELK7730527.1 hypothetical protein [Citrobacter freundii]KJC04945.1 hypothetical protein TN42_24500 [Citrobacter freundii]